MKMFTTPKLVVNIENNDFMCQVMKIVKRVAQIRKHKIWRRSKMARKLAVLFLLFASAAVFGIADVPGQHQLPTHASKGDPAPQCFPRKQRFKIALAKDGLPQCFPDQGCGHRVYSKTGKVS